MNTFVDAVRNQEARTENGMRAYQNTSNACLDLFFKVGASRGKNIVPQFVAAYVEDPVLAARIMLWARDVRHGAGEREVFRSVLKHLETNDPALLERLLKHVPEVGRWDDLLIFNTDTIRSKAFDLIRVALDAGNGLAAKWMPRKGPDAVALRQHFVWTPKFYRKRLVELTKVVEQDMCANRWDGINYSHVPSVAASRYKRAFWKHSPERYKEYVDSLTKGDPSVKINASAIFPHDVIKSLIRSWNVSRVELAATVAQWKALPNYVGDNAILPIVDVSGSMTAAQVSKNLTALDVSISLGLYLADKNRGPFKDTFLTFSGSPELLHLKGDIAQKIHQMHSSKWQMNTNLHAAVQKVLDVAVAGNAAPEDMPKYLLVLSDMQFDSCAQYDDSAMRMIRRKYEEAGYEVPNVIFWNLNARDNVPVKFNESGVGLVSGFSPAILKAILAGDIDPVKIMMRAVERYEI